MRPRSSRARAARTRPTRARAARALVLRARSSVGVRQCDERRARGGGVALTRRLARVRYLARLARRLVRRVLAPYAPCAPARTLRATRSRPAPRAMQRALHAQSPGATS